MDYMKINSNFKLREIAGETIIINQGTANINMTKIISLNESAALMYEQLQDKDFTLEDAAAVLVENYDIAEQQAQTDATAWVESLKKCGIIE